MITIEQKAIMLKAACELMLTAGAIRINAEKSFIDIHITKEELERLPGTLKVRHRDDVRYPFELSKSICGCEFYCIAKDCDVNHLIDHPDDEFRPTVDRY